MRPIQWDKMYSDTLEPDNLGRWARVGHIGNYKFINGRLQIEEIAWIKYVRVGRDYSDRPIPKEQEDRRFLISYKFPHRGKIVFDDLEEAKKEVEKELRQFLKVCQS